MIARRIIPKFLSVAENVSRGTAISGIVHGSALGILIVAAPQLFDRDPDRFAAPISIQIFEGVYQEPERADVLRIEPDLPAAVPVETVFESSAPEIPEGSVPKPADAPEVALPDVRPAAIEAAKRAPRPADAGPPPDAPTPGEVAMVYERGAALTPEEEKGRTSTPERLRTEPRERLPEDARALNAEIRKLESLKAQALVERKLADARKDDAVARSAAERLAAMERRLERLRIAKAEARVPKIEKPSGAEAEAPKAIAEDKARKRTVEPEAEPKEKASAAAVIENAERRKKEPETLTPAEKDRARQAVERYRKAAEEGIPSAEMNLARALDNGDGVEKDRKKAAEMMEKLARKGYEPAQIELARKHLKGDGVEKDRKRAYILLKDAAEEDNIVARRALRSLKDEMTLNERQAAEDEARRRRLEQKRAENRLPPARQKALDQGLREAVERGNVGKIERLLRSGADPNAIDASGRDAIIAAAWRGREMVVDFLIDKGVDIDTIDLDGRTPLAWAAINGHVSIVEDLLTHGADPNARDDTGSTPLIRAAWNGHFDVTKSLLEGGADPLAQDRQGKTALDRAREENWPRVVTLLEASISAN